MQTENKVIDVKHIKNSVDFYDLAIHFEEKMVTPSDNGYIKLICPFHKEDTPSMVFNNEIKMAHCFGCGISVDIIEYTMKKLDCSFQECLNFLISFSKINPKFIDASSKITQNYRNELRSVKKFDKGVKQYDGVKEEDVVKFMNDRADKYLEKGFTKETLDFFQVGFDKSENRVTIPVRDEESKLIGLTGRTIFNDYKERKIPKWKHYNGSNISSTFFNIQNAISFSKERNNGIIMCEGPSDAMMLWQNGFKNVVACLTNSISNAQKGILFRNFLNLYFFLDDDKGGEVGVTNMYKKLKLYFTIYKINPNNGKDPDELTKEELVNAICNAKRI